LRDVDSTTPIAPLAQVTMRLLDGLRGVSPTTYPKHPIVILSRIALKFGLTGVRFSIEEELTADSPELRYRGRARMRNIWLSSICYGSNRFSVRTKCAEEVLVQLRHDPLWLQQVHQDEEGRFFAADLGKWSKEAKAGRAADAAAAEADAECAAANAAAAHMQSAAADEAPRGQLDVGARATETINPHMREAADIVGSWQNTQHTREAGGIEAERPPAPAVTDAACANDGPGKHDEVADCEPLASTLEQVRGS
jgi:pyruvate/2-oxoglutarate dehydrogenase complex dihydrolipoamide acyltransferase (E2) component